MHLHLVLFLFHFLIQVVQIQVVQIQVVHIQVVQIQVVEIQALEIQALHRDSGGPISLNRFPT